MNVLFLTTNWPRPNLPIDGVFVREHARAAALQARVAAVHLARAAGERGLFDVERLTDDEIPSWRVRYRRFGRPASYGAFVAGAFAAFRGLRRSGFEPDVIHAHSFLSALPALALGQAFAKPVVYTEHWTVFVPENPMRLSVPMRVAARLALEAADIVLPVSADLARALTELAPGANIRVVPNVVDGRIFRPGEPRDRFGRRLLTAGLLDTDRKGLDILLEALTLLNRRDGLRLDVVGDGSLRAQYEALTDRLELSEHVQFHGLRSKAELAALMQEADLFVLGSRYENNPCVVIEAMATGLPVVATRVGGVPELVNETSGELANPLDPRDLARAIEAALTRLETFDRGNIASRARDEFGTEPVGRTFADVYTRLLSPR
jgi:glycosyltransferase involved in cell wall biosynthesis